MKKFVLILGWMIAGMQFSHAQFAPQSLQGFVQYRNDSRFGEIFSILVFNADGTYSLIYTYEYIFGLPPTPPVSPFGTPQAVAGTYSYQVVDANHGAVTYTPASGPPPPTNTETLVFTSLTRGISSGSSLTTENINGSAREEMVNTSLRTHIDAGKSSIAGFVIAGTRSRWVLIRAVGPGLAPYGVSDGLPDPSFNVIKAGGSSVGSAGSWRTSGIPQAALVGVMNYLGAFPLLASSDDAVLFVYLAPGAYTAVCQSTSGTLTGEVLTEVYVMP